MWIFLSIKFALASFVLFGKFFINLFFDVVEYFEKKPKDD
ncbi:hypothetical protein BH10BAC4_BH10BAC4_05660 [soil metagenome]